nr:uncharacterized protein LOC106845389 [Equus asinus]
MVQPARLARGMARPCRGIIGHMEDFILRILRLGQTRRNRLPWAQCPFQMVAYPKTGASRAWGSPGPGGSDRLLGALLCDPAHLGLAFDLLTLPKLALRSCGPTCHLLGVEAWLPFQSVLRGSPPVARAPAGLCPGFHGISSCSSAPFLGPLPADRRALALGCWGPPGTHPPPVALPAPGSGDRRQHGPILFNVEIKDPFTRRVLCLWSSRAGWQQAPWLWAQTHHPGVWVHTPGARGVSGRTCSHKKVAEAELTGFARGTGGFAGVL